jgi:hypothetical protein
MHGKTRQPGSVLALSMALGLVLPVIAQAQQPNKDMVPFKVVVKSKEDAAATFILPLDPPLISFKMTGAGEGTPIGPITHLEAGQMQMGVDEKPISGQVIAVMSAANGDAIFLKWAGLSNRTPEEYAFVVTGGRGRFKGATGSGKMTGTPGATPGEFTCDFDGIISAPR